MSDAPSIPAVDVSVIIVTWNTKHLALKCLDSLARSAPPATEVIVVDNNSSDGTADAIQESYPHFKVFRNCSNQGFAAAVNAGLRLAQGRVFFLLNPDTEIPSGMIEHLVAFFSHHPSAGIAGPPILNANGAYERSTRRFPSLSTEFFRILMLHRLVPGPERGWTMEGAPVMVDAITGAAMAIRRECVAQIGGMDPGFFLYYEDTDFCLRAKKAGWETWFVPAPTARHVKSAAAAQIRETTLVASHASLVYYFKKHGMKNKLPCLRLLTLVSCALRSLVCAACWLLGKNRADQAARLRAQRKIAAWAAFNRPLT